MSDVCAWITALVANPCDTCPSWERRAPARPGLVAELELGVPRGDRDTSLRIRMTPPLDVAALTKEETSR